MKKNKSKSKNHSTSKKLRKDLEARLALAINETVGQFGKLKKADKVIEKFAKQLSKKITIDSAEDSITPFLKEEVVSVPEKTEEVAKPVATRKPAAKSKTAVDKEVSL